MTTCPFCNCDPFHRTDTGEPVAVTCCDLGDLYFRGARPVLTECVILEPDEFVVIGSRLQVMKAALDACREKYGEIFEETQS